MDRIRPSPGWQMVAETREEDYDFTMVFVGHIVQYVEII
jgi:hypothetical protein